MGDDMPLIAFLIDVQHGASDSIQKSEIELTPMQSPGGETKVTDLVIEWKMLHLDFAHGLVNCWRTPENFSGVINGEHDFAQFNQPFISTAKINANKLLKTFQ